LAKALAGFDLVAVISLVQAQNSNRRIPNTLHFGEIRFSGTSFLESSSNWQFGWIAHFSTSFGAKMGQRDQLARRGVGQSFATKSRRLNGVRDTYEEDASREGARLPHLVWCPRLFAA
jgi:hypothetical protein